MDMATVTVNDSSLSAIAGAIRGKLGVETTYRPSEMAAAIASIEAGGTDLTSEDEGKVVVESSGEYVLAAQTSRSISQNGTYDTTTNDEVVVNVSGGSAVLVSKTITQNGTYNASSDSADGYSSVTVNVQGGGSQLIENWDLTQSVVGLIRGYKVALNSVEIGSNGAVFNATRDRISLPFGCNGITFEVDVASMSLSSGNHRRFIMASDSVGLIYRSTGVWAFYNNSWVESSETDGSFFDGSTVKVHVDENGYWHIYKDGTLWWEPSERLNVSKMYIGSSDDFSINNAVISGIRIL
jgi:hypothetical protein